MQLIDKNEINQCKELLTNPWFYLLSLVFIGCGSVMFSANMPLLILLSIFAISLVAITLVDLKYMVIPDIISLPLMVLAWVALPLLLGQAWYVSLLGSVIGFLLFFFIFYGFYRIKGYYGMGFGDVKLLATLGAWVGPFNLTLVILLSSVIAIGFFVLRFLLKGTKTSRPMPYGPFLALAAWLSVFYSSDIWLTVLTWRQNLVDFIIGVL